MVGARSLGVAEASAEIALSRPRNFGTTTVRLGYQGRRSTGDNTADVTLLNTSQMIGFGETASDAIYAGAGIDFDLANDRAHLQFDVTGFFGEDIKGAQASASLVSAF